ncbi:class D sortase [Robertmurraya korlensis]|uniref:class D sortase n=1 Tax=Robertmurraya korlensis TaxID=519977 RepID=UPI00203E9148|nr:class D sortase [Robertmurraya korlensis]MCM3602164.1 class D sortase [Robertmurraya korlensis]
MRRGGLVQIKYIIYFFIFLGLGIIGYAGYQILHSNIQAEKSLKEAKGKVEVQDDHEDESDFEPVVGEVVGLLSLPKVESELAIVEGTDPDELAKGVGHYKGSFFPGQGGQIVLSGHRDTVFKRVGELVLGDELVMKMPYGEASYEIVNTKIVNADDTSIITLQNQEEELILTTCYPFGYVGDAKERYIIYAKAKN